MPTVLDMPRKKNDGPTETGGDTATGGGRRPSKVFTVRVAKDLVGLAKKVAVLKEQSVEDYIGPILDHCVILVNDEITKVGIRGVRDRAESIVSFSDRGGFSTFITAEDTSTKLTSLAGQCLTSVAKLIDPYMRRMLQADYQVTLRNLSIGNKLRPDTTGIEEGIWELIPEFNIHYKWGLGARYALSMGDEELIANGLRPGSVLFVQRLVPEEGNMIVAWERDRHALPDEEQEREPTIVWLVTAKTGDKITAVSRRADRRSTVFNLSDEADRRKILGVVTSISKMSKPVISGDKEESPAEYYNNELRRLLAEFYTTSGYTTDEVDSMVNEAMDLLELSNVNPEPDERAEKAKPTKRPRRRKQ